MSDVSRGTSYASTNARNDIPLIADLCRRGEHELDELITRRTSSRRSTLPSRTCATRKNIRGVIVYDD